MAKLYVWNFYMGHEGYQNGINGWFGGPNSAGGVSVKLSFKNTTGKTIKYASFEFLAGNSVNDPAPCTISGTAFKWGKYTGPLNNDGIAYNIMWENLWYNHSITKVVITEAQLIYMDGTSEKLSSDDISFSVPEGVSTGGCYIATAVYGSYDCPQVWTLRRYRDYTLAKTWYGRAFIKTYYAISPTLVKWFGRTEWFKKMWQGKLDRMIKKLQSEGVESTPYEDKVW